MELTAAGKAGAEKMAATKLILRIQESISSLLLGTKEDIKGSTSHSRTSSLLPTWHPVLSMKSGREGTNTYARTGRRKKGRMGRWVNEPGQNSIGNSHLDSHKINLLQPRLMSLEPVNSGISCSE